MGFDPTQSAPALLAIVVALFVWRRHRTDRRARVFLAFAAAEFAFGLPLAIAAAYLPAGRAGVAGGVALIVAAGLVATVLFLHFGLSFPHARPWVRRRGVRWLYALAMLMSAGVFALGLRSESDAIFLDWTMGGVGVAVMIAAAVACGAIYRSYREMPAGERRTYRVPVLGVLAGMAAGVVSDLGVPLVFELAPSLDAPRYFMWTLNLVATFSELLLPLFFFMAAVRYRLLERHSPDYVAKL